MAKQRVIVSRRYVLDASALIDVLFEGEQAVRIEECMAGAMVSAVSHAEVVGELARRGADLATTITDLHELDVDIVPLDRTQAETAAQLRAEAPDGAALEPFVAAALAQIRNATLVSA